MRMLFSILALCFCMSFFSYAEAHFSYRNTNLVYNIKPNPIVRSKPTSSLKLASVQFLSDSNRISFDKGEVDVKTECAALGFVIPVSECKSPMVPSYLCSSELSREGANQYTTGCCNSNLYTAATMDSCTNNATALDDSCYWGGSKKYRCACDRSRYPYSELEGEGCGSNGDFNVNNKCMAPDATGKQISYYTNCCPTSYEECDASKHMVGSGNSCRVETSKGNIIHKYEECVCSNNYQTPCSGNMLIDGSDYCRYNNTIYTRENNCESSCDQTRETNVDSYLYGKAWHCLYEKDGAIIKNTEKDSQLCQGYSTDKILEQSALNDCEAQGYVKSVDDCYIKEAMLRCPTDTSKVWCLDGRYCTGFDVGNIGNTSACNIGAKIKTCPSQDMGLRCKYDNDECNKCWNDGKYTAGNCQNLDTSNKGDSEKCCKRGYKMENGICVANICNRELFPYNTHPGSDQGALEFCYEANPNASEGYDVYFGYASCNSNAAEGGLWKQAGSTGADARKCVCDRNREGKYMPFDLSTYFATNGDTSNNYKNVGFNQGSYGEYITCTDSDGSYYGYTSCYRGKAMGTSAANKGMCLSAGCPDYTTFFSMYDYAANWLLSRLSMPLITSNTCINYYTHCKSKNGETLGDESACALVVDGCLTGSEEACNTCYSYVNLNKVNGIYTAHGKYTLKSNLCKNGNMQLYGYSQCPDGFKRGGSPYNGSCYKDCYLSDISQCYFGDVLKDGNNKIGVVYHRDTSNRKIWVLSMNRTGGNWSTAMNYASNYAPSGYEAHEKVGKGKWKLPTNSQTILYITGYDSFKAYGLFGTFYAEGYATTSLGTWTSTESGADMAYYGEINLNHLYSKSAAIPIHPIIELKY